MATINVICYKSKTLANGENPLAVRITKDGKRSYKYLGERAEFRKFPSGFKIVELKTKVKTIFCNFDT